MDNFADQIDLDFTNAIIKNSQFKNDITSDNNGDGVDLSGSNVLLKNNLFSGFKDKGVSIGEKTKIVLYKNTIENNNMGAAVKDSSHAFFIENSILKNQIAISHYKKKPIYEDGGFSYLQNNNIDLNMKDFELDEDSHTQNLDFGEEKNKGIIDLIQQEDMEELFKILNPIKNE